MIPIVEVESVLISSTGNYLLVNSSSGALAVRLVDGDGDALTSTYDISNGKNYLDVRAVIDPTADNTVIIKDPNDDSYKVTTKDESELYPGVRSLDVNVRSGIVQVRLTGENLRYEEMTKDQALTNGVYDTIYTNTSTGKVIWARCTFDNNDIDVRVVVDGNTILDGLNLLELYTNYLLDTSDPGVSGLDFLHTENKGKVIVLNFPGGMEFATSFTIQVKANGNNYNFTRGLIIRAQES